MQEIEETSFSMLVSELQSSLEEVMCLAKNPESERGLSNEFTIFHDKFTSVLSEIRASDSGMGTSPIHKAVESLGKDLRRAEDLVKKLDSKHDLKRIENVLHDLGRSLALLLFSGGNLKLEIREKIDVLHKELMNARFDTILSPSLSPGPSPRPSASCKSEFVSDTGSEKEIEERMNLSVDDVVLHLKCGNDEELSFALLALTEFIREKRITRERLDEEGVISVLFSRLSSCKSKNRLTIIKILRNLVAESAENKEKMEDIGCLSLLVKSLLRDVEEQREAVGLLLQLSDLPNVSKRLGRIQGCIVMLVTILNGEDAISAHYAGKLLHVLSSNAQNALYMAEAGYLKPLVGYLKEGSEMSKILMATALSRMKLTDQSKISLGEDEAIEPLVKMFSSGKLEAKLYALNALQNLCSSTENIHHLINTGIVVSLLQLLFSVTSVLMTLREPASAILAKITQSESFLVSQDVAQQMLSLLNLSSPVIQYHLLQALSGIVSHSNASEVRRRMNESGAIQLLLPFLTDSNGKIRAEAMNLLFSLSNYFPEELTEHLGESHLDVIVNIISSSTIDSEKVAAVGILCNIPISDKKATDALKKLNLLNILMSMMTSNTIASTSSSHLLAENVAGVLIRFTAPSDKKLQLFAAEHGVVPLLIKLLSSESSVAKCRAATSLAQLSKNSLSLRKRKKLRWLCVPPAADTFCEAHNGFCVVKSTFCLVKAGAVPLLIQILEGRDRDADEAALNALATLFQDEIWENGSHWIEQWSAVPAILKILRSGNLKAQEKALWMLERVFRIEEYRVRYGESAQVLLIDLAQNGDPRLKSTTARLLAQLELLQSQSSYF